MAKSSGMGWTTLTVDTSAGVANDIRNDVTNFNFATPRGVQDITGVDKSAMERLLLLADFSITLNGVFNDSALKSHVTLKTIPSSSALRTVSLSVTGTVGANTLANECIFSDYAVTRNSDGGLTWSSPGVLADGTVPTWS